MEINAKLINSANATANFKITKADIEQKLNEVARKTAKDVKIAGFRAGKVPVNVVLARYGKELERDAKSELFKDGVDEALKIVEKKPDEVLGDPLFSKFDENKNGIDAEIKISFRPQISIESYESAIPEFEIPSVSEDEKNAKITDFLKAVAPLEKSDKDTLEKGDYAKFDFEGFVDGVAFDGGKAQNYVLEIGSNQFIPGFEDGMIGLKVGEEKDINVKFPQEYGAQNLAGKEAVFKVKLHEIQAKNIPSELSDEAIQKLIPNEKDITKAKFEERIQKQIRDEKFQTLLNEELKTKFADAVVEKIKFDLPKVIVEQEIDLQLRNAWGTLSEDERKTLQEDKDKLKEKRETYRAEAQKSVQLTFIIDEIARKLNIQATDQELVQTIYMEAYRYGIDPKKHLEDYQKRGVLPALKMAIVEEKLFNNLFNKELKENKK